MAVPSKAPAAKAEMMIRCPALEVYEAFVDPAVTTRFWFSHASGRLEPGATVRWEWRMYGAADDIHVRSAQSGRALAFDWGGEGALSRVDWTFTPLDDGRTTVLVVNSGFHGDADAQVAQALDSNGGFSTVLCAAKAWLEHGLDIRVVEDKFPQHWAKDWTGR
jgi:uncharacterized protein YndB with AHSA1/START domain